MGKKCCVTMHVKQIVLLIYQKATKIKDEREKEKWVKPISNVNLRVRKDTVVYALH